MDTNPSAINPIRVLVADDHEVSRRGLVFALGQEDDMQAVGEARHGAEVLTRVDQLDGAVDVVVMDVQMLTPTDGIATTSILHGQWPDSKVLLLTSSDQHATAAMRAGATGYVLKGSSVQDLLTAIRAVHKGALYYEVRPNTGVVLTDVELKILALIAEGYPNTEIATRLNWSPRSVTTHVSAILHKLNARAREHAVSIAMRRGLIR
ncbi:MAG TPA: response regulator transcription factor [Roseiflexaceae bacterium]|nr:response regulator transcription factor [Roseiflexaceae bacterium]